MNDSTEAYGIHQRKLLAPSTRQTSQGGPLADRTLLNCLHLKVIGMQNGLGRREGPGRVPCYRDISAHWQHLTNKATERAEAIVCKVNRRYTGYLPLRHVHKPLGHVSSSVATVLWQT